MAKTALITGVTGQDGSYLSELLLDKGYTVHGLIRRSSSFNTERIDHIYQGPEEANRSFVLHHADLSDGVALVNLLRDIRPDEVYNLGAQSHVRVSFDAPLYTGDVTGLGTIRLLEAVRASGVETRIYQASSSEMFGASPPPQDERTPFHPRSPYSVAKVYAYWATVNYREAYGMYAVNGILFNHESPRRGETFVTRKVTRGIARIKAGLQDRLHLGNLDAVRDWGYAPEYVDAMWRMLQCDAPDDYVVATGEGVSVRQFVEYAFAHAGLDWAEHVRYDPKYERPSEVDALVGDASKAGELLGWKPEVKTRELARIMVDADIRLLADQLTGATVRVDR
ncbi:MULTISPECIES: GDP-mannose 4,6-dehydratase [unclassified Streptomyces]|uniref:GDP-mannose 4,6-dehydratase n=1 Tax=Streptomyces salyersiae TaxID=3075530 RepID=A0ABU2RLI6_9ACTN|nr:MULTISPECIES: GDP-mannose 4,6-dehydratase [unclassified Streptomyces]AEN12954.1 GDP-mannose 4,6-dehydratase [Streptomyces sp. SirexAA-E]MDT0429710.1 GDP-mannose 4,6-dehydratase [Streptomyces sp. DSM 41770]MYR66052.1 GDP-mannose 4,6-dehydratase [Streptomyces sp. SID4939]MYS01014.1 GDP-mannose 4,6-dehydratase [Streptomyces sp. SID4940]MYT65823.1 GDP-mannose 4,6-dehydratase [Streptomyces sp. SID8357]